MARDAEAGLQLPRHVVARSLGKVAVLDVIFSDELLQALLALPPLDELRLALLFLGADFSASGLDAAPA
jgi:hypothetical protein